MCVQQLALLLKKKYLEVLASTYSTCFEAGKPQPIKGRAAQILKALVWVVS